MSKQKVQNNSEQSQNQIEHYLYADMDFINSFLAQNGQGLHVSSRHTNSNTDSTKEDRSSWEIDASSASSKKSSPTLLMGMPGASIDIGGDEKSKGDFGVSIEGLERGEGNSTYYEHAIEVALHDYAINLFTQTITNKLKSSNGKSNYFVSLNKEWNLLDYSDTLSDKLDAYSELFTSGLLNDNEMAITVQSIAPQARALLKVMNSSLPAPYVIRRDNRVGYLDKQWMRYPMKSLLFEFGIRPKFNVLGIKTVNSKITISDESLENPKKLLGSFSEYLDQNFLPLVTESQTNDQIFKPIVIFITLE